MNVLRLLISLLLSIIFTVFFANWIISKQLMFKLEKLANDLWLHPLILMGMPYILVLGMFFIVIYALMTFREKSNIQLVKVSLDPVLLIAISLGLIWGYVSFGFMFFAALGGGGGLLFTILFFPGLIGFLLGGGSILSLIFSIGISFTVIYYILYSIRFFFTKRI